MKRRITLLLFVAVFLISGALLSCNSAKEPNNAAETSDGSKTSVSSEVSQKETSENDADASDLPHKERVGDIENDGKLKYRLIDHSFYEVYGVFDEQLIKAEIPNSFHGYPVKRIKGIDLSDHSMGAFQSNPRIVSVHISEGIEEIGDSAFEECENLVEINLPASVRTIGKYSFLSCGNISNLSVAEENPAYCSIDNVLFTKDKKTLLLYPANRSEEEYHVPNGTCCIGEYAFMGCRFLKNVDIPQGVTTMEANAFAACSALETVSLSGSVETISANAFLMDTALHTVETDPSNPFFSSVDGVLFSHDLDILVYYPCGKTDETYKIPETVKTVKIYAFFGCMYLKSLQIPESTQTIESGAVGNNYSLEKLCISKNVGEIQRSAIAGIVKMDIYCDAEEKPACWQEEWLEAPDAVVHWNSAME